MKGRFPWFNATSIALGFAFLYIPILLLVIYSLQRVEARDRVGGFSTKWYASLLENQAAERCRMGDDPRGAHVSHNGDDPRHAGGDHARSPRPLPWPNAVLGHDLRAACHARRHHRAVVAVAVRRHRTSTAAYGRSLIAHITFTMCYVGRRRAVRRLQDFDDSVEEAAMDLGAPPLNTFFQVDAADHCAGASCPAGCWLSRCRSTIW